MTERVEMKETMIMREKMMGYFLILMLLFNSYRDNSLHCLLH
jgi:hypothetical protein